MDDRVPGDVALALAKGGVRTVFDRLPPSHQREYLTWIADAKRPATRERRIIQTANRLGGAKDDQ